MVSRVGQKGDRTAGNVASIANLKCVPCWIGRGELSPLLYPLVHPVGLVMGVLPGAI
jgi:hypothetical protein